MEDEEERKFLLCENYHGSECDTKNADDMIKKMELFGNDSKGLYSLDAEYAARVYTAPSLVL